MLTLQAQTINNQNKVFSVLMLLRKRKEINHLFSEIILLGLQERRTKEINHLFLEIILLGLQERRTRANYFLILAIQMELRPSLLQKRQVHYSAIILLRIKLVILQLRTSRITHQKLKTLSSQITPPQLLLQEISQTQTFSEVSRIPTVVYLKLHLSKLLHSEGNQQLPKVLG